MGKMNFYWQNKYLIVFSIIFVAMIGLSFNYSNPSAVKFSEGEGYTETKIIKKGKAGLVYASIKLPAGDIEITGNSDNLMDAKFRYYDAEYKPTVEYDEGDEIGNLKVELSKTNINIGDDEKLEWDIALNNSVPIDLSVKFGAGHGSFKLGGLNLQDFSLSTGAGEYYIDLKNSSIPKMEFKAGAGEATINLGGKRENNLVADFTCGFGELTVILPKEIGVKVIATGLVGTINYPGFSKDGSEYVNEKFGHTKYHVDLKITGAMGEINLMLE